MENYESSKEAIWDITHTDVYVPMLSISELSSSDLKMHQQWILRRKRIIYFLMLFTVAAVYSCAVSTIYVLPQLFGDSEGVSSEDHQMAVNDWTVSTGGSKEFPTTQLNDVNGLITPSGSNNDSESYVYCVLSANEEYQKFTDSCNAAVFRGADDGNLNHYFPEDFNANDIVYVRLPSSQSKRFVQDVTTTFLRIQSLTLQIHKLCDGSVEKTQNNLPSNATDTVWEQLNWLQINLQVQNECNPVYEMVSSWKMPKLQLLSFDRPYFSVSNQDSVRAILKKNSKIKSLRINQGVSCVHCDVFSGIRLPKLTKADIRWKQEFAHVLNQTKTLVSMAPGLTDFTLSLDLPVPEFIWMSKQLKHLKNAQFGIFLNKSEGHQYHLSLSTTIGFEKIENLTLRISVEHAEPNTIPLTIMDFQYLNPSLKCLTVMTKGPYAMNIASDSRRFCTRTHKILQKGQLFECCRY
ncbi:unnamed protein product [Allacma fusca]|uniref:Uncharacterized protein n=1 Tax=Allacma fusca TaxID=39272 RepID=A0A8J2JLU0_9HEXA|nr:unnamed protein product [Allacma fusca]